MNTSPAAPMLRLDRLMFCVAAPPLDTVPLRVLVPALREESPAVKLDVPLKVKPFVLRIEVEPAPVMEAAAILSA